MNHATTSRIEFLQGTLDLVILRTLLGGPTHGHAIAKQIQRTSEEVFQVETGSLYPALHRLEAKGWIAASWDQSDKGKRARFYRLTPRGRTTRCGTIKMGSVHPGDGLDFEAGRSGGPMIELLHKLRLLLRRSSKEKELNEEIQFHLDEEAEERQAQGLTGESARQAARRSLGNIALVSEDTRAMWTWTIWEQLVQDLRYALRTMTANKTFTALAIISLALGIGANTAIFSFMDSILMRSLPVPHPESLVMLEWHSHLRQFSGFNRHDDSYKSSNGEYTGGFFPYPAFELLRKDDSVFTSVFGYQGAGDLNLSVGGQANEVDTEYISGNYFSGLGVLPATGRLIADADDRAGGPGVAVISFALSEKRFDGPGNAPGRTIQINNIPFTVIGVAPRGFFGADPGSAPDVYIPMHASLLLDGAKALNPLEPPPSSNFINADIDWVVLMGRLRPGIRAEQAQAQLAAQYLSWERGDVPDRAKSNPRRLIVREAAGGLDGLRRQYSKPLYMLLTLVALILAIACANIANLLLARASARKREIAVRLSMGAGRRRVIRQLLTETTLLALLGGALGIGVAYWSIRFLTLLLANGHDNVTFRADLNWHVLAVAFLLSLLTGVLFGLAPAIQATRVDLIPSLKESRLGTSRGHSFGGISLRRFLVVLQIAVTLLILVAAGLFVRTFTNLESIPIGFNRQNVLTFALDARQAGHSDPEIVTFYYNLKTEFASIPGVRNASLSFIAPLGNGTGGTGIQVAGGEMVGCSILPVGSDFFTTMEIPILSGRAIDERDQPGAALVAVVNETFSKKYLGNQNPIGRHLALPRSCPKCDIEIVGQSRNTHYGNLTDPIEPVVYLSSFQGVWGPVNRLTYELRTAGNPLGFVERVREIVRRSDERIPLTSVATQSALIDRTFGDHVAFARLCTAFAILALTISCVGLYGTMSYNVTQRTGEIGIRMALGAQRGQVVRMVLWEVLLLVAIGLAISVPTAFATTKLVKSFLFGIGPNDPLALTAAVAILGCAAILAGYLPARSASRIDPTIALRHE